MPETSAQKLSLAGIFDQLDNNEAVSVRAGDLKVFLNQVGRGDTESSLTFAYRGIEQEAALVDARETDEQVRSVAEDDATVGYEPAFEAVKEPSPSDVAIVAAGIAVHSGKKASDHNSIHQ